MFGSVVGRGAAYRQCGSSCERVSGRACCRGSRREAPLGDPAPAFPPERSLRHVLTADPRVPNRSTSNRAANLPSFFSIVFNAK